MFIAYESKIWPAPVNKVLKTHSLFEAVENLLCRNLFDKRKSQTVEIEVLSKYTVIDYIKAIDKNKEAVARQCSPPSLSTHRVFTRRKSTPPVTTAKELNAFVGALCYAAYYYEPHACNAPRKRCCSHAHALCSRARCARQPLQ